MVEMNTAADPRSGSEEFVARTELARKLWEIRKRIVASGVPLLDWDGIEREKAERRGGVVYDAE